MAEYHVLHRRGGFVVDYNDVSKKFSADGTYTLPESGVIRVTGYTGALEAFSMDSMFSVADADNKGIVDPTKWRVILDGYTARECRPIAVTRTGDMLGAKYKNTGFVIIVK